MTALHSNRTRRAAALIFCLAMLWTLGATALAANEAERQKEAFLQELSALPHYQAERAARYLAYLGSEDYTPEQILRLVNTDSDLAPYEAMAETDVSRGALMLVNKHNSLGGYVPADLVPLGKYGSWGMMQREARDAFAALADGAAKDGMRIWGVSPYRSCERQEAIYNGYVRAHGQEEADTYSARPGCSEHQTGLAVDVAVRGHSYGEFDGTPECAWMLAHAHEYGFILRYGEGVEYITGYMYEPWHYRYVGVEAAAYIHEHGLTFEEYYYYYVADAGQPEPSSQPVV